MVNPFIENLQISFLLFVLAASTIFICYQGLVFGLKKNLSENAADNKKALLAKLQFSVKRPLLLGFFHPYCNAGGGGERVLWTTIHCIQETYPHVVCIVYTGDDTSKDSIMRKVKDRFNIDLDAHSLAFIHLKNRKLVEDSLYPRFTLLGQSLGSICLGWEALNKLVPDIYFDTMGYAFTYPLVKKLSQCKVAAYVHYPTISSDMLQKVQERRPGFNNEQAIANSRIYTTGKLIYYHLFALLYGYAGSFADVVMVNSTWTKGHIDQLWKTTSHIVYPPCDTEKLAAVSLEDRQRVIVSVAQFRPEKDHHLQLQALHHLLTNHPNLRDGEDKVNLVLIGSSRNADDEARIKRLKEECRELDIQDNVKFEINASYTTLVEWLSKAKIGLHTMWNEHFGIGVVEYMAAGLVTVAHNSGGPKLDIVVPRHERQTGFLANNAQTFSDAIYHIFSLSKDEFSDIQINARKHAIEKFSQIIFKDNMLERMRTLLGSV